MEDRRHHCADHPHGRRPSPYAAFLNLSDQQAMNYYSTLSRFWEIGIGGLLGLVIFSIRPSVAGRAGCFRGSDWASSSRSASSSTESNSFPDHGRSFPSSEHSSSSSRGSLPPRLPGHHRPRLRLPQHRRPRNAQIGPSSSDASNPVRRSSWAASPTVSTSGIGRCSSSASQPPALEAKNPRSRGARHHQSLSVWHG
jgi:hypothetical protein